MNNNSKIKVIIKNEIRILISDTKTILNKINLFHQYPPFATLILDNAIATFASSSILFNAKKIIFNINTNKGPIKNLFVEIQDNNIRGLIANPNIETEYDNQDYNKIPLILGIGDEGIFKVSRLINNEYFTSEVNLARADIISDFAYFLNKSDQIYSAIKTDVKLNLKNHLLVDEAKSILFQLLPSHSEDDIIWIEEFIKKYPIENYSFEELISLIDGEEVNEVFLDANCWCNKQKIIDSLLILKKDELDDLFKNDQTIEVNCSFCNKKIIINKKDINK